MGQVSRGRNLGFDSLSQPSVVASVIHMDSPGNGEVVRVWEQVRVCETGKVDLPAGRDASVAMVVAVDPRESQLDCRVR